MDTLKKKAGGVPISPADHIPGSLIVGAKQIRKALRNRNVRMVFLAEDADPAVTEPLEELCIDANVPCSWVSRMAELGRAAGIDVGAAAAAIVS